MPGSADIGPRDLNAVAIGFLREGDELSLDISCELPDVFERGWLMVERLS
jgi:hypothetical protein